MPFLTVEGLDGSGGTTLVNRLGSEFKQTVTTKEPSELWTGGVVRRCLQDDTVDPLADFYFFMGDRVQHIEETIKPMDKQGFTVASDRYADSTRAYQPVALAKSDHFVSQTAAKLFIEQTMVPWVYEPDLTVYIDVSVDTALDRCNESEKYEKREFLTEVKKNYTALVAAEEERFIVIDGEQSKEDVANEAIEQIKRKI